MKRSFVPAFLNNFDRKLLLNKPNTWSTRVHFVLYFSLLFILLVAGLSFFAFFDTKQYSDSAVWTSLTALLCFIGLIIWLIYLLRFNVFKRYGKQSSTAGIKTFSLFFVGMSFIVLPAFVPTLVESFRANQSYNSNEMVKDMNTMNKSIIQLNHGILPKSFIADTVVRIQKREDAIMEKGALAFDADVTTVYADTVASPQSYIDRKTYLDPVDFNKKLSAADSLKKLSDSVFIEYNTPVYTFIFNEDIRLHSTEKMPTSFALYNTYVKQIPAFNKVDVSKELRILIAKYGVYNDHYDYYVDANNDSYYETKIRNLYDLQNVSNGLYNISEKKYRWDIVNFGIYFRVFFYCAFVLTLLLFIFRHSTIRTFFLTLLTSVVIFILSAIVVAFGRWEEYQMLGLILLYYVIFGVLTFLIFQAKKRQANQGIGLNIVTMFTAFLPLIVLAMMDSYNSYQERYELISNYKDYSEYYKYAEVGGVLLFLILLQPVIKKAYRKWYALPEN